MQIGILTQYYGSCNYGGLLQAYALARVLNGMGHSAEQICYDAKSYVDLRGNAKKTRSGLRRRLSILSQAILQMRIKKGLKSREQKFAKFRERISHSEQVYSNESIVATNEIYDAFVAGSDQIWNPKDYDPVFFLSFANSEKIKMSYAASISQGQLDENQQKLFKEHLKDFDAVSLRENDAHLIQNLSPVDVEWVLDPTFILSKEEWDEVAAPRMIDEKYVLCYILGKDENIRNVAKEFAKKKNLKLVTMPHLNGLFEKSDSGFGDKQVFASPEEFISLIKNAEYVITDSFHATAFSTIYEKEFFVFHRSGFKGMASRIESILSIIGAKDHFCDDADKATVEYVSSIEPIDFNKTTEFAEFKKKSLSFLQNNLNR